MFRLRSKSGDESVFRTAEEIRAALLSGFVTPDAQIWDAELKGWVPLLEHALYKQIAAPAPGRKSGATKAMPPVTPSPGGPKVPSKLVIKRPGDGGTTSMPAMKRPAPPAPAPPRPAPSAPADEMPDLELIDLDLTPELEPVAPPPAPAPRPMPPPAPRVSAPPPAPAAPPKRPTPPPPAPAARASTPRHSTPRVSMGAALGVAHPESARGGGRKWLIIGAVLVLAGGGGAFALLGSKGGEVPPAVDSTSLAGAAPTAAPIDSTRPDSAAVDTTARDTAATLAPGVAVDAPKPIPAPATVLPPPPSGLGTGTTAGAPAGAATGSVAFAPVVARGPTPWTARPVVGTPLSIPALEVVRLRYLAAQSRTLEQFEAGLEAAGFTDLFDPARVGNANKREESLDAVDAGRSALRDFRRRQSAIDFAYTDSMRQALPAGSDTPDFRTFGPILRESPVQAALTDSIVGEVAEVYGMLVGETGGYTFRGGNLTWKDADNSQRYQTIQERLTSQIARSRTRSPADVPPALAAILRGIGLPR
jgi:hypothetical protein